MATQSSLLAEKVPWTEEPGGLQSVGSQRVGHDWGTEQQWVRIHGILSSVGILITYFYFDVFQLLQGGSDQMLRSLHLQKSLSAYNYIHVGAQLKVSVSFLRWFRYRIKESEGTLINYRFQPATLKQMNDSYPIFKILEDRDSMYYSCNNFA